MSARRPQTASTASPSKAASHQPQCSSAREITAGTTPLRQRKSPERGIREAKKQQTIPDVSMLLDLEAHARSIASGIDMALRDLRGSLRGMSDLTYESTQVFGSAVNSTCDVVDTSIRSTYAMLAKAEEFNESMRGIEKLLRQIKEVKRLLDLFEDQFSSSSSTNNTSSS